KMASKIEAGLKGVVSKSSNLFEALGFRYFGAVDGHNIIKLVETFKGLRDIPGPKLLHVKTVKGKGYELAEKDQTLWHAPGTFDKITGKINKKIVTLPEPPKYQDVFGHTLLELAQQNSTIMGITPAMPSGCSMKIMMDAMPNRAMDVGIAEQHAVTLSAGLATQGMKVFCNIYSSFMQRAYDMVIHDVALQHLPVVFCLDRAGLVGDDGPTHHGAYDIAYMRCVPDIIVSAPMNESELRNLMYTAQLPELKQPFVIRYPRGQGVMPEWRTPMEQIMPGTGRQICAGEEVAILTFGHPGNFAVKACKQLATQGLYPAHYDMRFAKPLDEALLHTIAATYPKIVTVEDGTVTGGFGSAVLEFLAAHHYHNTVHILGIPDRIVEHGSPAELQKECGYDAEAIATVVKKLYQEQRVGELV
ncbi:MAG: 1-deoxy-D-xylulose-5-phosphate synthase, partial [Chitinophagia bacterium]|nr:1-deoxy-D-xylulose-5-phosphate synthase [Chitinophagia bacterium]